MQTASEEQTPGARGPGFVARWSRRTLLVLLTLAVAVPATIMIVFAVQARLRIPDLSAWHRISLENEYRVDDADATTFREYLQLEELLFAEMKARILDDSTVADRFSLGRYNPSSFVSALAARTPGNRSFELVPDTVRGGVLLVHGLTDAPYWMRVVADTYRAQGFHVVVLRLPGHGTIPASLAEVDWRDWYGAVELAVRHVAERAGPGRPLHVGGFSTGGAVTTLYSLRALADSSLPRPTQLVLFSPAIGIPRSAMLTRMLSTLAFIPYFEKARWLDVYPEYDPYKYKSFPVNAAKQIYLVTREVHRTVQERLDAGGLAGMPRVLAFQSLVDATVSAHEVYLGLFRHLQPPGHELVVFDINRAERLQDLIQPRLRADLERIRAATSLPFRLTLIGNRDGSSQDVVAHVRDAGQEAVTVNELGLQWPTGVLSLGHGATPLPADDPYYGLFPPADANPRYPLGALDVRGESGTLVVSLGDLVRMRSNPFFQVVRDRIVEATAATP